jgi:hypothetical protein
MGGLMGLVLQVEEKMGMCGFITWNQTTLISSMIKRCIHLIWIFERGLLEWFEDINLRYLTFLLYSVELSLSYYFVNCRISAESYREFIVGSIRSRRR